MVTALGAMSRALPRLGRQRAGHAASCTTAASWRSPAARFEVHHRPGHSPSDTIFFDPEAGDLIAGDHLIKHISSNPLISAPLADVRRAGERRPHALQTYMDSLRATRAMPIATVLPGHGEPFGDHAALIDERFAHARAPRAQVRAG